jgi:hypothetical protein
MSLSWLKVLTSEYPDHSDTESIDSEVDGINNPIPKDDIQKDEKINSNSTQNNNPLELELPKEPSTNIPGLNLSDLSEKLTTIIDELESAQETTPMTPENIISTQTPEPTQPYWMNTLKYYLCYCLAR